MLPEDLPSPAVGRLRSAPSVRSVSLGAMSRESASLLSLSPSERLGLRSGSPAAAGGAVACWASGSGVGSLSFWACASLECRHFIRRFWNHTFTCGRTALSRVARPAPRSAHRSAHLPAPKPSTGDRQSAEERRHRPQLPLPAPVSGRGGFSLYLRPTPPPPPSWCFGLGFFSFVCFCLFFSLSFYFFFQETNSCSRNHSVIQFCALRAVKSGIIAEWRLMIPFEEDFSLPQN